MKDLSLQTGVQADADYLRGRIANGTTLVGEGINQDIIQFFQKLISLASITPNGNADNEANGYQTISALSDYILGVFTSQVLTIVSTGTYNPTSAQRIIRIANQNIAGLITINLPTASSSNKGQVIYFDANVTGSLGGDVVITGIKIFPSNTILGLKASLVLKSTGSSWVIASESNAVSNYIKDVATRIWLDSSGGTGTIYSSLNELDTKLKARLGSNVLNIGSSGTYTMRDLGDFQVDNGAIVSINQPTTNINVRINTPTANTDYYSGRVIPIDIAIYSTGLTLDIYSGANLLHRYTNQGTVSYTGTLLIFYAGGGVWKLLFNDLSA